ncbi:neutral/alkaline non-lysosomal ceramidase N-terminal domain-containing protein [uncultured Limnobacter sp.]|uniref:neutral/alkaline non-lysosomal ceramidase N-terminal domain-containing protein n=1 Tax=uncultured Limnobacter sp. TaxID=199681 RepID=UPI0030FC007C
MKIIQWNVMGLCLLLSACLGSNNDPVTASRTDTNENSSPVIVDPPPGNGGGNGGSNGGGGNPNLLDTSQFRAASAKRNIDPTPAQIQGVVTSSTPIVGKLQQFNLGGYGGFEFNGPEDFVNFDIGGPPANGIGDGTFVRVFVLEGQTEPANRVVFVTIDAIGAGNVIQNKLKAAVAQAANVPPNNVLFAQTHSHSGADLQGLWGGVPASWLSCEQADPAQACDPALKGGLYQLAAEAAAEAVANLKPAYLDFAQTVLEGEARLNNFRRCDPDDSRTPDPTLTLLQARTARGDVLGSVLNYSAHPTVLNSSNRLVHTDWVGGALRTLERNFNSTVLYYNGAIADSSPRAPAANDPYEKANAMGVAVAQAAMNTLPTRKKVEGGLLVNHATAFLPVTNPLFVGAGGLRSFNGYYNFTPLGEQLAANIPGYENLPQAALYAETPVSRIQLGQGKGKVLELVTIPGEGSKGMADSIRARSSNPMMLMGLTHNSLGYILTENEFGNGLFECQSFYEETVSLGPFTTPALNLQAYDPLFER